MILESILFEKSENFKIPVLPCFGGSVAGMSSREPQSHLRWSFLATCSRVGVQSRGSLRDFRGSPRDLLAGRPSSREKHLEKFFKILFLSVLATLAGDCVATYSSRENRVFGRNRSSFKTCFSFPSNICNCSSSL